MWELSMVFLPPPSPSLLIIITTTITITIIIKYMERGAQFRWGREGRRGTVTDP